MNYFKELAETITRLDPAPLLPFVRACQGTLWVAGNGGSASTAQHWACDLSKAAGQRVQALGSNPAVLTAWANDEHYSMTLAREFEHAHRPGDAIIALSCSGTSDNIMHLRTAAECARIPFALVTSQLHYGVDADLIVRVPHTHYGIIEDCHLAIGHWLTEALCSS